MDTFQALADPNRRQIIELLAKNWQLSSTDISENFKISAPAISQHLKILREANLVKMEKKAQTHLYRINPEKVEEISEWVEKLAKMWDARMDRLEQILKQVQDDNL